MPAPSQSRIAFVLFAVVLLFAAKAHAQDLYDPGVLRSFHLSFHDADWQQRLRNNYVSQTLILADLTVDDVTYPDVGVRIRGNTSYMALPSGSEKFSLKIVLDHVHSGQELLGYDNLNLNNGFRDPTFLREVVYNNHVAQFVPNPRANHVQLTINGQNWGVYINVQQPNKRMLRDYFTNADGLRIKCANNPLGPGLAYNGPNASGYAAYEIQNDGGLVDPLAALIDVTFALSNEPLSTWPNIDALFAIDPSIWSVVLENLLTDDDSYVNKGCDFMAYRDPVDGRLHLLQRDANETFTATNWAVTRNFSMNSRPLLSRVLAVPELRQRYLAHYRTALADLSWAQFEPVFQAQRDLIAAAVEADPKKLYSYTLFQSNFTSQVTLPHGGLAGGTIVGLQQFVNQRASFLAGHAELNSVGPEIVSVQASAASPSPADPVWITAQVQPAGNPVAFVELFYRPAADVPYQRAPMLDDGQSGDGAAGDGVYGVLLPVVAQPGYRVPYYVAATAANAFQSLSFHPARTELAPLLVEYGLDETPGMRITEWMYAGAGGEFVEFTNLGAEAIDLDGWSMDDDHDQPGAFDLSAFGLVQPGESVIVTEALAEAFRADWSLGPEVRIIGELGAKTGNNLGRNDQIHLYDASGAIIDRLYYGDQTYPGSIRTQNRSGQADCEAYGANDVLAWVLSDLGDGFGSYAAASGDLGTPGFIADTSCVLALDRIFADGFED